MTNEEFEKWTIKRWHNQANAQIMDGTFGMIGHGFRYITIWIGVFVLIMSGFLLAVIGVLYLACAFIGA